MSVDKASLFLPLQVMPPLLFQWHREAIMKTSDHFRASADNCAQLAESAVNEALKKRYKRMEEAWRALADEQDWLDGEVSPGMEKPPT
jgi:hypothetical protein